MKWGLQDVEVFIKEKEYIDTVLIPLIPLDWGGGIKSAVTEGEFIMILSQEVERQLKGRILLSPSFTYLKSETEDDVLKRLDTWLNEIKANGIKYITLLTSDVQWKQREDQLEGLVWFPAIPLEQMETKYRHNLLSEHTQELLKVITKQWQQTTR